MRPGPDIFGSLLHGVQKVAWEVWGEQRGMFFQEFVQIYPHSFPLFPGEKHDWDGDAIWGQV